MSHFTSPRSPPALGVSTGSSDTRLPPPHPIPQQDSAASFATAASEEGEQNPDVQPPVVPLGKSNPSAAPVVDLTDVICNEITTSGSGHGAAPAHHPSSSATTHTSSRTQGTQTPTGKGKGKLSGHFPVALTAAAPYDIDWENEEQVQRIVQQWFAELDQVMEDRTGWQAMNEAVAPGASSSSSGTRRAGQPDEPILGGIKRVPGCSVPIRREEGVVAHSTEKVWHLLWDCATRHIWDPLCDRRTILRLINSETKLVYNRLKRTNRTNAPRDFFLLMSYHKDPDSGAITILSRSVEDHALCPLEKGYVRASAILSGTRIAPHTRGSYVTFLSQVDVEGWVPAFIKNWSSKSPPRAIALIRHVLANNSQQQTSTTSTKSTESQRPPKR